MTDFKGSGHLPHREQITAGKGYVQVWAREAAPGRWAAGWRCWLAECGHGGPITNEFCTYTSRDDAIDAAFATAGDWIRDRVKLESRPADVEVGRDLLASLHARQSQLDLFAGGGS